MTIQLTDKAISAIQAKLDKDGDITYLRIGVKGGSCSGYKIVFEYEMDKKDTDIELQFQDVRVIVDPKSAKILEGATIDYHKSLIKSGFVLKMDDAKFCGCGSSFSKTAK